MAPPVVVLDIESAALPEFRRLTFEPDAKWLEQREAQPWSDDGDMSAWLTRAARAGEVPLQATGCKPALHPATCQVVAIAAGSYEKGVTGKVLSDFDGDESALVSWGLRVLEGIPAPEKPWITPERRLVTFGGKSFDVFILRVRAMLLRIQPAPRVSWSRLLYPYDDTLHADLRLVLGNNDRRARGTQQFWAERFGVKAEDRGAEVQAMVDEAHWEDLRAYNSGDAQTLLDLWEQIGAFV